MQVATYDKFVEELKITEKGYYQMKNGKVSRSPGFVRNSFAGAIKIFPAVNDPNYFPIWVESLKKEKKFIEFMCKEYNEKNLTRTWTKLKKDDCVYFLNYLLYLPMMTYITIVNWEGEEEKEWEEKREVRTDILFTGMSVADLKVLVPKAAEKLPNLLKREEEKKSQELPKTISIQDQEARLKEAPVKELIEQIAKKNADELARVEENQQQYVLATIAHVEMNGVEEQEIQEADITSINGEVVKKEKPQQEPQQPLPPPPPQVVNIGFIHTPTGVSNAPRDDVIMRDPIGYERNMPEAAQWTRFWQELKPDDRVAIFPFQTVLKQYPNLMKLLVKYLNDGRMLSLLMSIHNPDSTLENNIFDYLSNANSMAPAITRAPSCWSSPEGAAWMLSPDNYNMATYVFLVIKNKKKNWVVHHTPDPISKYFEISDLYQVPDSESEVHLFLYCKNNYTYLWSNLAGSFQHRLDQLIDAGLPSPGLSLLNLPEEALSGECLEAYRIKRDRYNPQSIKVNLRVTDPPSGSIPSQLKKYMPTEVDAQYSGLMLGSDGSFIANLLKFKDYKNYRIKYMKMMEAERQKPEVIKVRKMYNGCLLFQDGLPVMPHVINVEGARKEIREIEDIIEEVYQNQGLVKMVCYGRDYLHDLYVGRRYLANAILGECSVIEHDNCLFLIPFTWKAPPVLEMATVVPVVGDERNCLSDGCGQDKKILNNTYKILKKNAGGAPCAMYWRSIYVRKNNKGWVEDLDVVFTTFVERLTHTKADVFIHPVPWTFIDRYLPILNLLKSWAPVQVLLPCPPSYYCPVLFLTRGDSERDDWVKVASQVLYATVCQTKLLMNQFFVDTPVISVASTQNKNLKTAFTELIAQVSLIMPDERVRGNAFLPAPAVDKDRFNRKESKAKGVSENLGIDLDSDLYADL